MRKTLAPLIVMLFLAAACGGDSDGTSLSVSETQLGSILVDSEGLTLYVFDPDRAGESVCYDECARTWPPLMTEGTVKAGDGARASLLGTTQRRDGSLQITYAGSPLYYYDGDSVPGELNGQGLGDVWWVVTPAGSAVRGG